MAIGPEIGKNENLMALAEDAPSSRPIPYPASRSDCSLRGLRGGL